ncbi:ATPase, T2SS/T4P/T4SS family [Sedimentibacter sp. MB35-C1]|uniref:ATPase, T2SS/T4P/T4SS family n=1 Tax=Sedimentibacter sp. MB35-C1 TaxID=3070995 RepID=UPI0027E15567|nr:ATPase, T2SS/T4P/T4SS family [Sedimentibacter sp. MB35-C1]WMJ77874.1 ATPase, T2SS/T4P/T4SS family [Sedimentibacter sp. MB35-C1]
MEYMEYDEIEDKVYEKIVKKKFTSQELSDIHTQMLFNCSAGDIGAKKYVKVMIKNELLGMDIPKAKIEELITKIYANRWGLKIIDKYDLPDVDEIITLGTRILLKKQGDIIEVNEQFRNYDEVIDVMRRSLEFDKSKDLNELNPSVLAERADGARIQITIPTLSRYPVMNIRKHDSFIPTPENMLKNDTFTEKEIEMIATLVKGRANILVIGPPESGKTATVKWLIRYLNDKLIIGLLESDFEMNPEKLYPNKYFIPLRERDKFSLGDLFAVLLQKSINLIILTEARSREANELIKAMTRGLSGSMGTAHITNADSVPDALTYMIMEGNSNISFAAKRNEIASAIDIVIEMKKLPENEKGQMKKIGGGIFELIEKGERERHETVPISRLIIDEENPHASNKKVYENTISQKLKKKLNENGVKMSEIKRIFGD